MNYSVNLPASSSVQSVQNGETRKGKHSPLHPLPPHSTEAEQGVLGCILLDPNESLGVCVEKLREGSSVFYELRHRLLYERLVALYDADQRIDPVMLIDDLRGRGKADEAGGLPYLNHLMDAVPSAANLPYYLDILIDKALLRKTIGVCTHLVQRAKECQGSVDALMDEVERDVLRISQERIEPQKRSMKILVKDAVNKLQSYHDGKGALTGLSTGFPDLDKMTHGLHGGEMIVIAARPSMGKTSLAMNIAEEVALKQKLGVGVFSLEMTAESLTLRMLCSRAKVNMRSAREGFFANRDFRHILEVSQEMSEAPMLIDDTAGLSILQLRARARRMAQHHPIRLFVIDYLQLLGSTSWRTENRQQEIAEISSGVKALAKELSVPVIVLSQLNRELERDRSRKPRLSDLRESGAIEQDADLVGLLYRPEQEEDEELHHEGGDLESEAINLLIAKQRNGPTGDVNLVFRKALTRFESASKLSDRDIPRGNQE